MKNFLTFLILTLATALSAQQQPGTYTEFWGMTSQGGTNGSGVIFKMNQTGQGYEVKKHLSSTSDGANPFGNLVTSGSRFFGFTFNGGEHNYGTIFSIDTLSGGSYAVRHHFTGDAGGWSPLRSPVWLNGKLYGVTYEGGNNWAGTIFEYDTTGAGTFTVRYHFAPSNSQQPYVHGLFAYNGKLFGMSEFGGTFGYGVLFEYNPSGAGNYVVLHNFSGADGRNPDLNTITESNGKLYGMTPKGGANNLGVLFEYNLNTNAYNLRHNFAVSTGYYPFGGSLVSVNGTLYGMTSEGGSPNAGVIFKFDTSGAGTYSVLRNFNSSNGRNPIGSLIHKDGVLYGMTVNGGNSDNGVVFRTDTSATGTIEVLHHFNGTNGKNPYGDLTPITKACTAPIKSYSAVPDSCPVGAIGTITFALGTNPNVPYQYSINGGQTFQSSGVFSGLDTGTYRLTMRVALTGCISTTDTITLSQAPDAVAPVFTCPAAQARTTTAGTCVSATSLSSATGVDNCGVNTASITPIAAGVSFTQSGSTWTGTFPPGTNIVTFTGSDVNGNSGTCTTTVTVTDTIKPVLGCPSNQSTTTTAGQCGKSLTLNAPSISDNCGATTPNFSTTNNRGVTITAGSGVFSGFFPTGSTTITFMGSDNSGNTGTCTTTLTISDTQQPTLLNCPVYQVKSTSPNQCATTASWTAPTATDNCTVSTITGTHVSGTVFSLGTTTVRYTAIDNSGNTRTCTFNITVNDTQAPTLTCPAAQTQPNSPNDCSRLILLSNPGMSDNCTPTTNFSQSCPTALLLPIGSQYIGQFPVGTHVVTFSGTDQAGNTGTCTTSITIQDTQLPLMVNCPTPISMNPTINDSIAIVTWNPPSGSDNCPGAYTNSTHFSGATFPIGVHTVTYTVTDAAANTAQCSFMVTILPPSTWYLDMDGDGFGNSALSWTGYTQPSGFVVNSTDCNDTNPNIHPDATEVCNGMDDNCDGQTDEGLTTDYFPDADGDGYGAASGASIAACSAPSGYVTNNLDCDDTNPSIRPSTVESCNGQDDNCNGQIDENLPCERPLWITATYAGSTTATLRWAKSCGGALNYIVRYRPSSSVPHTWITVTVGNVDSLNLSRLCFNTLYNVQVRTNCPSGLSAYLNGTFSTANIPTCTNPYFTAASSSSNSVFLDWVTIPSNSGQRLQYRAVGTTAYTEITIPTTQSEYTITGLMPATQYQYRIRTRCNGAWLPFTPLNLISTLPLPFAPRTSDDSAFSPENAATEAPFLRVNPNPSRGDLRISTNLDGEKSYTLLSVQGRQLTEWKNAELSLQLDLSDMPEGAYILILRNAQGVMLQERVVIVR